MVWTLLLLLLYNELLMFWPFRKLLEEANSDIHIISKIENAEGVKNIDEIIQSF